MNNQEAFNTVLAKLRTQRVASSDGSRCMYRSDAGCCAVGHLLPADLDVIELGLNSTGVASLMSYSVDAEEVLGDIDRPLLRELQFAHDLLMPMPEGVDESVGLGDTRRHKYQAERGTASWEAAMQRIAAEFNLNYEVPA